MLASGKTQNWELSSDISIVNSEFVIVEVYTYLVKRLQTIMTLMSLLSENHAFWQPFWKSMMSIFVPCGVYNAIFEFGHGFYGNPCI